MKSSPHKMTYLLPGYFNYGIWVHLSPHRPGFFISSGKYHVAWSLAFFLFRTDLFPDGGDKEDDFYVTGWLSFSEATDTLSLLSVKFNAHRYSSRIFLFKFGGHIHIFYFGATGTPALDFWWRLLWVSKPLWLLSYSQCGGKYNVRPLRSTSVLHIASLLMVSNVGTEILDGSSWIISGGVLHICDKSLVRHLPTY